MANIVVDFNNPIVQYSKPILQHQYDILVYCAAPNPSTVHRVISSPECSINHSTQADFLFPCLLQSASLCEEANGVLQTAHRLFLLLFSKDLARMKGTPQPNQKLLLALGIAHESLPLANQMFLYKFLCKRFQHRPVQQIKSRMNILYDLCSGPLS